MTSRTDRRAVLLAAGMAASAVFVRAAVALPVQVGGTVTYEGGATIPEGEIEISIEGSAAGNSAKGETSSVHVRSDGKSKAVEFVLAAAGPVSGSREIVARLERADGWLMARGSATLETDVSVQIILNAAMY